MKSFDSYHPVVLIVYFISVIAVSMFSGHPVLIALALFGGFLFNLMLERPAKTVKNILFYAIFFLLITITNPLFSNNGVTVLFFLDNNAVTLEALLYGMFVAAMLIGVMYWFKNYTHTVTSEKFIYLFGRIIPKLSLIFSMVLRFIPLFISQLKKTSNAQKSIGVYSADSYADKIKSAVRVFSLMVTWSLENSIEKADSMKARGYGIKGRSHFSIFKFSQRDGLLLALTCILFAVVLYGMGSESLSFSFYPAISKTDFGKVSAVTYISFAVLVCLPAIIELKERFKWKYFMSKI